MALNQKITFLSFGIIVNAGMGTHSNYIITPAIVRAQTVDNYPLVEFSIFNF